jgi:arylsulfatase A-like enzyme
MSYGAALGAVDGLAAVIYIVLDSMRLDAFSRARIPNIDRLCPFQERRHSYATWTRPSHLCLLGGLFPFESRPGALAAQTYTADLTLWSQALAGNDEARVGFAPRFSLARFANEHGWRTIGRVAMPVLNEQTSFSDGFDTYQMIESGGNLGAQIESALDSVDHHRPFIFINCGDTHYPYLLPKSRMPRISGLYGVANRSAAPNDGAQAQVAFAADEYAEMRDSQIKAIERADRLVMLAVERLPKPFLLIVTSDHGELFGEDGFFGHGPFAHPLLLEVPLAMGVVR